MRGGTASTKIFVVGEAGAQTILVEQAYDAPRPTDPGRSTAATVRQRMSAFSGLMAPVALAAAFAGPDLRACQRSYLARAETPVFSAMWTDQDELFTSVTERVTAAEIAALNLLLATPYSNDAGFEYFADD